MLAPGSFSGSRLKILTALIGGCLFLAIGFYLAKPKSPDNSPQNLVPIAQIASLIGEADHRFAHSLEFEPATQGMSLHSGETLLTRHASEVVLTFNGGGSVRLGPGARFVAERDASGKEGAVLGTVVEGEAKLLSLGSVGSLRILKGAREIGLETPESAGAPIVSAKPANDPQPRPNTSRPMSKAPLVITATTPIETPTPHRRSTGGENIGGPSTATAKSSETLGNDEIRKSLRSNGGFFQRCYLTYLNRVKPDATTRVSTVTVGFMISSSGKVRDAKIVRTDFADATLNNCVLETIERTSFRAFRGNDIPVLEFPIELN